MKRINFIPTLFVLLFLINLPVAAQEDLVEYFPAGQADAELLVDGYLATMGEVIGSGINGGWYTNGAPHSKLGIEFNITANTVFIPSSDEFFPSPSLSTAQYERLEEINFFPPSYNSQSNPTQVPTIYGPVGTIPVFSRNLADGSQIFFKGPDGNSLKKQFQINAVVVPTIQLGIGIIKNTDLKLRYAPEIDFDGTKFSTMGIGIMHSIKDHIPGLKMVPIGWSLLVAYSRMTGEVDLSGQWDGPGGLAINPGGDPGHVGEFTVNGTTIQTIFSKKFAVITAYGAVGYNIANSEFDIKGEYWVNQTSIPDPLDPAGIPIFYPFPTGGVDNQITIRGDDFKTFEYDANGVRFTAGLRLKLGPLTLHSDYTIQRTNVLTFGIGFSVKE